VANPRKFIFDTDPGVDDAMAFLFAMASPELELVGVTSEKK
jgi:purine nucleosidase